MTGSRRGIRTSTCCSRRLIAEPIDHLVDDLLHVHLVEREVGPPEPGVVQQRVDQGLHAPAQADQRLELRATVLVEPSGVVLDQEPRVVVDARAAAPSGRARRCRRSRRAPGWSAPARRCAPPARARRAGARAAPATAEPCARPPACSSVSLAASSSASRRSICDSMSLNAVTSTPISSFPCGVARSA